MVKHFRYLGYVLRHKWYVLLGGLRLGVPLWQLLVHDWSKFLPVEWFPYVNRFYGSRSAELVEESTGYCHRPGDDPAFDAAWEHHWRNNPHHWQYWVRPLDARWLSGGLSYGDCVTGVVGRLRFLGMVIGGRSVGQVDEQWHISNDEEGIDFWAVRSELSSLVLLMPDRYVSEMVADWYGAGMAQDKPETARWWVANRRYQFLHPATTMRVRALLERISC